MYTIFAYDCHRRVLDISGYSDDELEATDYRNQVTATCPEAVSEIIADVKSGVRRGKLHGVMFTQRPAVSYFRIVKDGECVRIYVTKAGTRHRVGNDWLRLMSTEEARRNPTDQPEVYYWSRTLGRYSGPHHCSSQLTR